MIDTKTLTIKDASSLLSNGEIKAEEIAEACLKKIGEENKDNNIYLEVYSDVMESAKNAQKLLDNKSGGLLAGIPISLKDNILVDGKNVTAGSKILEGYTATYDATVIKKLKEQGAVFLGRTNMDEFAMGGSTEHSAYGVTRNPFDKDRVAGGSSGGSAASVATGTALGSLGSDTGGSVRQPASFCGVVGLKPTYGAVSRFGLIAMGSSLDQIGPIAKTVDDVEIIYNAIRGKDPNDSTSIETNNKSIEFEKKVAVPRGLLEGLGFDEEVRHNFEEMLSKLKESGVEVIEVDMPNLKYALPAYYIIMPAEAATNLSRFDGVRYGIRKEGKNLLGDYMATRGEGFGKEVRRRILLGTYILSAGYYDAYYNKAVASRKIIEGDFDNAFKVASAVVMPTSPSLPFKIGEKESDPLSMYLADIFTVTANITGHPAISIPSGFGDMNGTKLPIGFQIMAPKNREDVLFGLGRHIEKIRD